MSTIDMTQVAGIQAVNAEGKVIGTLSVDDLTELVATKIVQEAKNEAVSARSASVMSEASTLAATDEYEDQLALDTNPAYVRSLDSDGNPKRTATTSLATVVGGLLNYYKFDSSIYNDDLNLLTGNKYIRLGGDCTNLPSYEQSSGSIVCCIEWDLNSGFQVYYGCNTGKMHFRGKFNSAWKQWVEVS